MMARWILKLKVPPLICGSAPFPTSRIFHILTIVPYFFFFESVDLPSSTWALWQVRLHKGVLGLIFIESYAYPFTLQSIIYSRYAHDFKVKPEEWRVSLRWMIGIRNIWGDVIRIEVEDSTWSIVWSDCVLHRLIHCPLKPSTRY